MANHRAVRHSASHSDTTDGSDLASAAPATPSTGGKRKAVKPSRASRRAATRSRSKRDLAPAPAPAAAAPIAARAASTQDAPRVTSRSSSRAANPQGSSRVAARSAARPSKGFFALLPSAPTAVGAAALVIAATGAVTVTGGSQELAAADSTKMFTPASAMTGTSDGLSSLEMKDRTQAVSRDSQRGALDDATDEDLQQAVEAQAQQRNAALAELAASAEQYAGEIAANAWHLPMSGYHLTAGFGESSGLWASTHTGLDFAGPTGTPAVAVASGTIRSVEYAGAYGNRVVLALNDGTEIWYCHLSAFSVSVGESVTGGEQVGLVGATGNVTGPHLHIEVRPGAGDPVDPYAAFVAHGITP